MRDVLVIGSGVKFRKSLLSVAAAMAAAVVPISYSFRRWGIDYDRTHYYQQAGWAGAREKDRRTQQRRQALHNFYQQQQQKKRKR